ncbi:alpha/beta hydrolase [Sphaerisporangium sp. NPDC051017]|uniref:alpha/beta fold hydrolase n=1 Tax=Sphaerisporangium sp. NPDC051017 TaxID=3154636 RepID=UPI0034413AC8
MSYRTTDVEVRGGRLRAGVWESADLPPDAPAEHTVYALHGVTSSHLAWALVAERLVTTVPRTRLVAPDLRGRGRSAGLPGPWGMRRHADDLHALVGTFGRADVTAGHSMGGFAVMVAAHRHPGTLGDLVLVDGGVPLPRPEGVPIETLLRASLGPAAERLAMTFDGHDAYRRFWRAHPALAGAWSPAVEAYVDYDLAPGPDGWHSSSRFDAVAEDSAQLGGGDVEASWDATTVMPTFLRSPLGLLAEPPGLYPPEALDGFAAAHPGFRWDDVEGTNHYTVLLGPRGAERVAGAIAGRFDGSAVRRRPDRRDPE